MARVTVRVMVRVTVLAVVVLAVAAMWRRWRGPWPLLPQPNEPAPAQPDEPVPAQADWVEPGEDGECPASHPVKASQSGIYHLPGGRFYGRTKPERCYRTPEAAERDGYRRAKA